MGVLIADIREDYVYGTQVEGIIKTFYICIEK